MPDLPVSFCTVISQIQIVALHKSHKHIISMILRMAANKRHAKESFDLAKSKGQQVFGWFKIVTTKERSVSVQKEQTIRVWCMFSQHLKKQMAILHEFAMPFPFVL